MGLPRPLISGYIEARPDRAWLARADVNTTLRLGTAYFYPLLPVGLEWSDVGPAKIAIRRAWVRGRSRVPKSGKAREVPTSAALGTLLSELRIRVRTARAWQDAGPIFLTATGGRWDEANFGRAWRRLQKLAVAEGVRPLRFHDARHTFASWALESGRSIKWVQTRLGHSSAELTLRTYTHLMPEEGDEISFLDARPQDAPERPQAVSKTKKLTT